VVAADSPAVDLDDGALTLLELRRGELVGLQDRNQVIHSRRPLEPQRGDAVAIADRADHRQQLAPGEVSRTAHLLDSLDDVSDLLLRRPLFHHDHHLNSVSEFVPTGVRGVHRSCGVRRCCSFSLRALRPGRTPS
jgi:hypothetical protein